MARGRPRQFDEEQVLSKAAQLFRERGYGSTSMQALSQAMGIGEQSIYNAFGSKEELFERAVRHYCSESKSFMGTLLAPGASRPALEAFFSAVVKSVSSPGPPCLAAQTCLTAEDVDSAPARTASAHLRNIEKILLAVITNAVKKGESRCDDPKSAARFLNMTLQGLNVMGRSGTSKRALRQMVDVALQVLD